ncbi:hypothetical protein [Comamonas sp. JNW]|uniref:beta family protein n=1 Tax=Comamonas sp. JNW TaxID=2170731 RepID=UPI000DE7691C|nr:hypothetical protein [Comamonas sp. JNW]PWB18365.1 hypothetical protein DCO45_10385 [Comamonas sp. JNW]
MKFKVNEVAGLSALSSQVKAQIKPFFDIPRKDGMKKSDFEKALKDCRKKADKYLKQFHHIFIDSFDIPDNIAKKGSPNCASIIKEFENFNYIPVLGLDRSLDHNDTIFKAKDNNEIISNTVAVRLQSEEFLSYELIEYELQDLINEGFDLFDHWIFIFDCRFCANIDTVSTAEKIADFIKSLKPIIKIQEFIITGSSIPAAITDIAKPSKESIVDRTELAVFHHIQRILGENTVSLGDYTIVSPNYSEINIEPELLLSVTAPKVFYTYQGHHYIARGSRIKTHGYGQYDEIFESISVKKFFRGSPYSWGDNFIQERANGIRVKNVTPSTVLKPTICAHITYMANSYPA